MPIVFIVTIFFSSNIYATDLSSMEKVENQCLNVTNWDKKVCELIYDNDYAQNDSEELLSAVFDLITEPSMKFLASIEKIYYELIKEEAPANSDEYKKAKATRSLIKNKITDITNGSQMNSCQKACLIKCVTSNYIEYEIPQMSLKNIHIEEVYTSGKGKCTEFAMMANDLSDNLGLQTRVVSNFRERHAYNQILIDNQWFQFEPQSDSCEFFISKTIDNIGENETDRIAISQLPRQFDFKGIANNEAKRDFTKSLSK